MAKKTWDEFTNLPIAKQLNPGSSPAARARRAIELLLSGRNGADAVLCAFYPGFRGGAALGPKCGLEDGHGTDKAVCGAFAAAMFAVGLVGSPQSANIALWNHQNIRKLAGMLSSFETTFGTCLCRGLLGGLDLSTADGREAYLRDNLRSSKCTRFVKTAVQSIEQLL